MQYQIYWQPQTTLKELQGAVIDFLREDEVHYTNHFLPSGQVIATWTDSANYFEGKAISDLPRLRPGQIYQATRRVKNSRRMHAYLNWTFYNSENQVIASQYQNTDRLDLRVPDQYDHYRLDLMSAGTGDFTFYEVTVAEKVAGWLHDNDQLVTDHLGAYLDLPEKIVSKTLRVILAEPELERTNYPISVVKESPQAVLYLATDLVHCQDFYDQGVLEIIAQAKKAAKAKNVEFVGYGLISAMAALQYRQAVKGSKAMIPDPNQLELPAGFERRSSGLADFIASLPEKIDHSLSPDDGFLVSQKLAKNTSPILVPLPQVQLLKQLSYPEWPETKEEKAERIKAEKKRLKQEKKRKKTKGQQSTVQPVEPAAQAEPTKTELAQPSIPAQPVEQSKPVQPVWDAPVQVEADSQAANSTAQQEPVFDEQLEASPVVQTESESADMPRLRRADKPRQFAAAEELPDEDDESRGEKIQEFFTRKKGWKYLHAKKVLNLSTFFSSMIAFD